MMINKMVINTAISRLMRERGVTQKGMASSVGKERPQDISARLQSKNMTFNRAIEMLDVLGYEVVVQPRKAGKRPDGQIVIVRSDIESE